MHKVDRWMANKKMKGKKTMNNTNKNVCKSTISNLFLNIVLPIPFSMLSHHNLNFIKASITEGPTLSNLIENYEKIELETKHIKK